MSTDNWAPPYPAPDGYSWREQGGRHYLAHETATIGKRARIGERTVIGERARIGERTVIGEGVRIGEGAVIGGHVSIDEWVSIGKGSIIGEGSTIAADVFIGKRTMIGDSAFVDRDAIIAADATIGEGTRIGEGAIIGKDSRGLWEGVLLEYRYAIYRDVNGVVWMSYGCKTLTADEWREGLRDLCETHEPSQADLYESAIGALLRAGPNLLDAMGDDR